MTTSTDVDVATSPDLKHIENADHGVAVPSYVVRQPPAGVPGRPPRAILLATFLVGGIITMFFGGLTAAYFNAQSANKEWIPEALMPNTYQGGVFFALAMAGSFFAAWAAWATRTNARRQSIGALCTLAILYFAFLNLGWFFMEQRKLSAGSSIYATISWTLLLGVGVVAVLALVFTLVVLFKTITGLVGPGDHELVLSAAWFAHMLTLVSVVTYWLIWYVK